MRIHKSVYEIFYKVLVKHYRDVELADYPPARNWKLSRKIWKTLIPHEHSLRSLRIAGTESSDAEIFYRIRTEARASEGDGHTTKIAKDVLFTSALIYLGFELPQELTGSKLDENTTAHILLQLFLEKHNSPSLDEYPELKVFDTVNAIVNAFPENKLSNDNEDVESNNDYQKLLSTGNPNTDVSSVLQKYFDYIISGSPDLAFKLLSSKLQDQWGNDQLNIYVGFAWTKSIKISAFDIEENQQIIRCKIYIEELFDIKRAFEFLKFDFYKSFQIPTRYQKNEIKKNQKLAADKKFIYEMVGDLRKRYTAYTPLFTYNGIPVFTLLHEELSNMKLPSVIKVEEVTDEKLRRILECSFIRSGEKVLISNMQEIPQIGSIS